MRKFKIVLITTIVLIGMMGIVQADTIDPAQIEVTLCPGESTEVDVSVTVPIIPPTPDIYFLADTTGSMGSTINTVKANIGSILSTIKGVQPNAQFGAGRYRDFPHDSFCFSNDAVIGIDDGVGGNHDVSDAVQTWSSGGGYDGAEGQFFALHKIATDSATGWRDDSTKIVVWFGDYPAHDPVCSAISGLGYDITETSVTNDLINNGIIVIAISVGANRLDSSPTSMSGDYSGYCGIDGSSGQATRITTATGGVLLTGVSPTEIANAILDSIMEILTDVWWTVDLPVGIEVTLDPVVYENVAGGTVLHFDETIAVLPLTPPGDYQFDVTFWANNYPQEGAILGTQTIIIHQPCGISVLDQEQAKYTNNFAIYSTNMGAQSFKPTLTTLSYAEVYMRKVGNPPGNLMVSIRSSLTGADLVSLSVPPTSFITTFGWVKFDFSDIPVTPGNTYYLVLKTSGGSTLAYYNLGYSSGNVYTNGALWTSYYGQPWYNNLGYDLCFRTYGF